MFRLSELEIGAVLDVYYRGDKIDTVRVDSTDNAILVVSTKHFGYQKFGQIEGYWHRIFDDLSGKDCFSQDELPYEFMLVPHQDKIIAE